MRIFSILAAIAVAIILAMSILARPQLLAMAGMDSPSEEPSETANTGEGEPDAAAQRLVKVMVRKMTAEQVDSAVILRGQTAAAVTRSSLSSARMRCPAASRRFIGPDPRPALRLPGLRPLGSTPGHLLCPTTGPPSWRARLP